MLYQRRLWSLVHLVGICVLIAAARNACAQSESLSRVRRINAIADIAKARRDYLATLIHGDSGRAHHDTVASRTDSLAAVRIADGPTPDDVDTLVERTQRGMDSIFKANEKTEKWLGLSLGAGTGIVKVGQYAGSGGAIIFGLNAASDTASGKRAAGRNAAYSAALAAGVTVLEQLFNLDEKKARAAGCRDVDIRKGDLRARTEMWRFKRNNEKFRNDTLPAQHDSLFSELRGLTQSCLKGK